MRVRFAPSPTGALHIGGIRTALYNYLLARQHGGSFILRIEDTDQNRLVEGAENYIIEALSWCGLIPDEGPGDFGGDYGPYRQSERKQIYRQYAEALIKSGNAYYAFDTTEDLETARKADPNFMYNQTSRMHMRNSLTLNKAESDNLIANGDYTIRLKVPETGQVKIQDLIRGEVVFDASQIDDKVMLKGDGMPTYHLANVVDDHLMEITHVIRGEEWLPSTAHHILLYKFLGWESTMPSFSHLPLILKPNGNGKLSKRDGAKFNIPVFPLAWEGKNQEDSFIGFREAGFLPEAMLNFMAMLGWNDGSDKEMFSLTELIAYFSIDRVHKSGAKFDYEKALWFNHQYIQIADNKELALLIKPLCEQKSYTTNIDFLEKVCMIMKSRVQLIPEIVTSGYFLFTDNLEYDHDSIHKKWKPELSDSWQNLIIFLKASNASEAQSIESEVKNWMQEHQLKPGEIMPLMRLALAGTMQGPGIFEVMELLGKERSILRMELALTVFNNI